MKISLIIPCYNEEVNLQKGVLDKIGNFVKNNPFFYEIIIVDDGSTDRSKKIIKEKYLPLFKKIKIIEKSHQGKGMAVISGIKEAQGEYIMFSDIDLATPIEESEKLIQEVKNGFPIVIGSRKARREGAPFLRKVMAVGGIVVRSLFLGLKGIHDSQCGFKIFKKNAALDIISHLKVYHDYRLAKGSSVSAGFDYEFLFLALKLGYKIKEVPVSWRHVETKNVHFFKDSFEALKDVLKIKYFQIAGKYQYK